jgi:capsid protein
MATKTTTKRSVTAKKPPRKVFNPEFTRKGVSGSYDIARSTDENANIWKYVDSLSAAEANSPGVRQTIRNRARYEVANNSYADGIVDTLAADTIGAEIQLQLGDSASAQRVERDFAKWANEVNLWHKIRVLRRAKCVDGESFAMFITNKSLMNRVKLDLKLIECDMVESWGIKYNTDEIDGIKLDGNGNPIEYRVLKTHPGDYRSYIHTKAGDWIKRKYMVHYFSQTRPGQVRGVSELLPALSLFGELRLFTKAVINSAARAAELTAIMYTDLLPDQTAAELADPITVINHERNAIVSLPEGWKMQQLKAEQPTNTYQMFKAEIINEIARCLNMPSNVARGDSSGYNYASGRLDHQTYDRNIEVERGELKNEVLDRIFAMWLEEYGAVANISPREKDNLQDHAWHFSGRGHVDPNKEASADDVRLKNGTLTRARYWAKQGADWKREEEQWIKERITLEVEWNKAREAAGLPPAPFDGGESKPSVPAPDEPDTPEETGDVDEGQTTED